MKLYKALMQLLKSLAFIVKKFVCGLRHDDAAQSRFQVVFIRMSDNLKSNMKKISPSPWSYEMWIIKQPSLKNHHDTARKAFNVSSSVILSFNIINKTEYEVLSSKGISLSSRFQTISKSISQHRLKSKKRFVFVFDGVSKMQALIGPSRWQRYAVKCQRAVKERETEKHKTASVLIFR